MGKSLPRTVLDATLSGWESLEVKCTCGKTVLVPLAGVSRRGPDLAGYGRRLRCSACGAAPATVRRHRRLITVDGPREITGPIAGLMSGVSQAK